MALCCAAIAGLQFLQKEARLCACGCHADRVMKDLETGEAMGVVGSLEALANKTLSSQPIASMDWHPDKAGLFVSAAFDQCIRVGMVTKVHSL
jgi:hypothetical protein